MNYKTSCLCYLPKPKIWALIIHDIMLNLIHWLLIFLLNMNALVSVWWDGKKADCDSVIAYLREYIIK